MTKKLARRELLGSLLPGRDDVPPRDRGRSRRGLNTVEPDALSGSVPLPAVISWLADAMEAPAVSQPARTRAPLALHRPPGAVEERSFMERCTGCSDCRNACPHGAILKAPPRFREAAGTPYIDPGETPCWLCEDMPCVGACTTQALVPDADAMGTAHIDRFECLNALGNECSTCVERCPVPGALTRPDAGGGRSVPLVYAQLCTGCGVCQFVCPAPNPAIGILPNVNRRTVPVSHIPETDAL